MTTDDADPPERRTLRGIRRPLELGAAIRTLRREQGLTQADLAQRSGVGRRFVSEVENGKFTAEIGRVCSLLAVLGYDFELVPQPPPRFDLKAHLATFTSTPPPQ